VNQFRSDTGIPAQPNFQTGSLRVSGSSTPVDLLDFAKKANKKAVPARAAMVAMLYDRLAPIFDPPKPRKRAVQAQQAVAPSQRHPLQGLRQTGQSRELDEISRDFRAHIGCSPFEKRQDAR
jgi:hypothetical protein